MRKTSILVAATALLIVSTGVSSAAVFSFDFRPNGQTPDSIEASGMFTTDGAPSISNITAVSGTVNGAMIAGIDGSGFNIYLPDTNSAGFSFLRDDGVSFSLFNGSNGVDTAMSDGGQFTQGTLSISPYETSAVPLPASAPLFGAALLGLAGLGFAAKRKTAAAAA